MEWTHSKEVSIIPKLKPSVKAETDGTPGRSPQVIATLSDVSDLSPITISDEHSGRVYVIDCGAAVSVFPRLAHDREDPSKELIAANGSRIKTYGPITQVIHFGGKKYVWKFIKADVNHAYVGRDFMRRFNLFGI